MNEVFMKNRILVADDQTDVLESLHLLLKSEGFTIDAVTCPAAAVEAVRSCSYDVLLLDMNYARDTTSGGEGLELLSRILQIDDALPVVLMTAWGSVGLAVEAIRTGGYDFVEKPWDNGKLIGTLRRNIEDGRLRRLKKRRLEKASAENVRDLDEAHKTQLRLLPVEMPQIPGIELQATWRPARDVGGDYFDAIKLNENILAVCIADVAGKGLPAALTMSNIQAAVRAYASVDRSPSEMCRQLNRVVWENTRGRSFITLFYGLLDSAHGSLLYTNAGHVPPILVRSDGLQEALSEGGTILGPFPDSDYQQRSVSLQSGDHLILITDGITEAANSNGEQFSEGGRISQFLSRNRSRTSEQIKDALLDTVTAFAGPDLQDDATLMVVSML
jgi:sigma-B regulation protein RsbU (phosphoserine phosphatase)